MKARQISLKLVPDPDQKIVFLQSEMTEICKKMLAVASFTEEKTKN